MEKICVAVRVRPPGTTTEESASNGAGGRWKVEDNRISLFRTQGTPVSGVSYAFDHVFDESCTNSQVYELLTKDIIHAAVEGFNGTAFAYGQTSSGKTFTMKGSETDPGVINRAVRDIFERIQMVSDREFLIRVSYMEIYNEEINDLLAVENQKLQIHESLERGIFVAGLREEIVCNAEQVLKLIEAGEVNRHFGETNMNARSSRSHTIFRMVIESKGKENSSSDAIRVSVLNLVDLAGSERIAKTGAGGVRLKEGKYINKSLMILGNVINKLSEGAKLRAHIPYRDSKLTRILQTALGGNAKTSIICTIAPEEDHIEESKGTLQFASRAKRITNCAQVNEILTDAALLKRQKLEIEELRSKLQGSRTELLEQEILNLRNDMLKYELEREKLETQLEEERRSQKIREQCFKEQQMNIKKLTDTVSTSQLDRNCSENVVARTSSGDQFSEIIGADAFKTPQFKAAPNNFVVARSNYPKPTDFSPLPESFGDVADEDLWLKMNKGFNPDLDSLQITPFREAGSLVSSGATAECSSKSHKEEAENLKRQLELLTKENNDLERKHKEQLHLNDKLMEEMSELKQEALSIKEMPKRLCESVAGCKDIFQDISSTVKNLDPTGEPSSSKLFSATAVFGMSILSNFEAHFSLVMDSDRAINADDSVFQEHSELLRERLKSTLESFLSDAQNIQNQQTKEKVDCATRETTYMVEKLTNELNIVNGKHSELELEFDANRLLLDDSRKRYKIFKKELHLIKEERDSLKEKVSETSQTLTNEVNELNTVKGKYSELELEFDANRKLLDDTRKRYNNLEKELHLIKEERDLLKGNVLETSQTLTKELNIVKGKHNALELEFDANRQLLDESRKRFNILEEELHLIKEERDSLKEKVLETSQTLTNEVKELNIVKGKYREMELEFDANRQLLDDSRKRYNILEKELHMSKEERDSLNGKVLETSQTLTNDLNNVKRKYSELELEFDANKQLLADSKRRYNILEKELRLMKEERESLNGKVLETSQTLTNELNNVKRKYSELELEFDANKQLLGDFRRRYNILEKELHLMKEERESLSGKISETSQTLSLIAAEKENVLKDLNMEVEKRKEVQEKMKHFSVAFASRHKSHLSFYSEFKSKIDKLRSS